MNGFRIWLVLALLIAAGAEAAQPVGTFDFGGRIGIFSNSKTELASGTDVVRLFGNKNNIYVEAAVGYYFLPQLELVANLGSYSKGDIRFEGYQYGTLRTFFGSAGIYPIQLGVKLSPFQGNLPLGLQPFVEGGGALIVGTETIDALYYDTFQEAWVDGTLQTETNWNWWFGGGAEIPVSQKIYLDGMVKFMNVEFSGDIAGIRDYSGWQISFGVGYLFLKE